MRPTRTFHLVTVTAILFSFAFISATTASAQIEPIPVSPSLLPATTKGVVMVTDANFVSQQWEKTQLGQLMQDPVMEPFSKDLKRQFSDRLSRLRDRLGLELSDLKGVPGGGMAFAMIQPAKNESAMVMLIDIRDHQEQGEALLAKVTKNLTESGGTMSQQAFGETPITIFDMPETRDYPKARVGYFISGNILGASDRLDVMEWILNRRLGKRSESKDTLADVPAFQEIMERCQTERGKGAALPQIIWFVEPLGYIEALRAAIPETQKDRKGATVLDVVQKQGFEEIKGVGGFVDMMLGGYEFLYNVAIYAPGPFKPAPEPYKNIIPMKMFLFPNATDFAPAAWIPNDVASYTSFYWDILAAFDNVGPLFDQLVGEGEAGVWEDIQASLRDNPTGPEIDLRSELVQYLGPRITVVTDYLLPITTTSERLLIIIDTKDPKAVARGIEKAYRDDSTAKKRTFQGHMIWEIVEEQVADEIPSAPVVDLPDFTPDAKKKKRILLQDAEEKEERLLPHMAVTVVHGKLVVASHYDFLIRVLDKERPFEPLAESIDFRMVQDGMKKLGAHECCVRSFSRTDEAYRPTYEMIRQNKMPESEAVLGRVLNAILGPKKRGAVREQKVDGSELPDFQVVRRYLGPGGLFGKTEKAGWFFTGFMLKK